MAKTLRVRTRAGWTTKPSADLPENRLTAGEVDDNFLAMLTQEDAANQTDPLKGAGLIGYREGTVGDAIDELVTVYASRYPTTRAGLQEAWNNLPVNGGVLVLPKNTTYSCDTTPLQFTGKSNVEIRGAGMGSTVIYYPNGCGADYTNIYIGGTIPNTAPTVANITVKGITFRGSGTVSTKNIIRFSGANNITFDGIEIYGGYREVLYANGPFDFAGDRVTIKNSYFHDNFQALCSCINLNTLGYRNVDIINNTFERVSTGLFALGENINISGNKFREISNIALNVAESNYTDMRSLSSCVITNNTFSRLGINLTSLGGFAFASAAGIRVGNTAKMYANGTNDSGCIVSNNSFVETKGDVTTFLLYLKGGVTANNNYATGLSMDHGAAPVIFAEVEFASDVDSYVGVNGTPNYIYLNNNVLEKNPSGNNIGYGIRVTCVDNSSLYCSGNKINAETIGAYWYGAGFGFVPFVSFDGDIVGPVNNLYHPNASHSALTWPSFAATPAIYGSNTTTFSCVGSPDLFPLATGRGIGGSATPSISRGNWFWVGNASPTTITNFTNYPASLREIMLTFDDANTTIQNGGVIHLKGGVNFVSSKYATITLVRPSVIGDDHWHEK